MPTFNEVLVAVGFDQTLDANDNIETFTPNVGSPQKFKASRGGMVYFAVSSREFSEGEERFDPLAAQDFAGHKVVIYVQPACHTDSYAWLITNYRGQVTCQVCLDGTTYEQWNALLQFEKSPSDVRRGWYSVNWKFILLEEVS